MEITASLAHPGAIGFPSSLGWVLGLSGVLVFCAKSPSAASLDTGERHGPADTHLRVHALLFSGDTSWKAHSKQEGSRGQTCTWLRGTPLSKGSPSEDVVLTLQEVVRFLGQML